MNVMNRVLERGSSMVRCVAPNFERMYWQRAREHGAAAVGGGGSTTSETIRLLRTTCALGSRSLALTQVVVTFNVRIRLTAAAISNLRGRARLPKNFPGASTSRPQMKRPALC